LPLRSAWIITGLRNYSHTKGKNDIMKAPVIPFLIFIALLLSSCSIKRHLPKGALLFDGSQATVKKTPDNPKKAKPIKKNKMIFGYP
jgi:hypothetical protein